MVTVKDDPSPTLNSSHDNSAVASPCVMCADCHSYSISGGFASDRELLTNYLEPFSKETEQLLLMCSNLKWDCVFNS